jgi:hypothetical protein
MHMSRDGDVEWVACGTCGHEGPAKLTARGAIDAWNTRSPPAQPEDGSGEVERLREALARIAGIEIAESSGWGFMHRLRAAQDIAASALSKLEGGE